MVSPLDLGQPGHSSWSCYGFTTPPRSSCLVRNSPGPIPIDLDRVKDNRPTDSQEETSDLSKRQPAALASPYRACGPGGCLVTSHSAAPIVSPVCRPA